MDASEFIVKQKVVTETRYLVEVNLDSLPNKHKRKWFNRKHYIIPWVAKQNMLPMFDEFHAKYGCERDKDDRCVWDEWAWRKDAFIKHMKEDGLDKAIQHLYEYLCDWF